MGQLDRQRHELGRVVAGVAEHEALVAGALGVQRVVGAGVRLLVRLVHALGDVGGLLADGDQTPQDSPSKPLTEGS